MAFDLQTEHFYGFPLWAAGLYRSAALRGRVAGRGRGERRTAFCSVGRVDAVSEVSEEHTTIQDNLFFCFSYGADGLLLSVREGLGSQGAGGEGIRD